MTKLNFKNDYRSGFEWLTKTINTLLPAYQFTEIPLPDGTIQRWWRLNDESIVITYKDEDSNRAKSAN